MAVQMAVVVVCACGGGVGASGCGGRIVERCRSDESATGTLLCVPCAASKVAAGALRQRVCCVGLAAT